jgi:hypothetical protein
MDLKTFEFPKVNGASMAFPTLRAIPELLKEAKERGFYNGNTPYNKLFSDLFFSGGKIQFKKDVNETLKAKAWPYCRAFMGSFEPSHEDKEAICALIMSELLEPKLAVK